MTEAERWSGWRGVGAVVRTGLLMLAVGCGPEEMDPGAGADAGPGPGPAADSGAPPELDAGRPVDAGTPDTNVAVVRLNADGSLDPTFGTQGVAVVDFGPGEGNVSDSLWSLAVDAQGRAVLFGNKKGDGARVDTDRVVARLTAEGTRDPSFGTDGMHVLNIANLNDHARNGVVQADGKIVVSGYTSQPTGVGTQSANRVVLLRLNDDGTPDGTFGAGSVVNSAPFQPADPLNTPWGMAEAYAAGFQNGKYVTTGYGRSAASGQVDMVSFRYTDAGGLDTSWGSNGVGSLDVAGDNDRGRNLVVLPDNRVVVMGSATPSSSNVDAMVVVMDADGALDTSFDGDGYKLFDWGRADEAFFGVAATSDGGWVAGAGYRAGAAAGGATEDEDAAIALIPLGGGTEFAQPTPLSETEDDRFFAAAFDSSGKLYAAGFVVEGGDSRMVVARFNSDGSFDSTFGSGGVVKVNVATAGTLETARGVVVQSDGKVLIAGTVEAQ